MKDHSKIKKIISIVAFVLALFFLLSCLVYKVSAADGSDTVVYELSQNQYVVIVSLLSIIAVSSLINGIVKLTRKG